MKTELPFELKVVLVNDGKPCRFEMVDKKTFVLTIPEEVGIKHAVDFSERYRQDSIYRGNFR